MSGDFFLGKKDTTEFLSELSGQLKCSDVTSRHIHKPIATAQYQHCCKFYNIVNKHGLVQQSKESLTRSRVLRLCCHPSKKKINTKRKEGMKKESCQRLLLRVGMRTRARSTNAPDAALCCMWPRPPPSHHLSRLCRKAVHSPPQQQPPPGERPSIKSRSAFYDAARVQWSPTPPLSPITACTVRVRKRRRASRRGEVVAFIFCARSQPTVPLQTQQMKCITTQNNTHLSIPNSLM